MVRIDVTYEGGLRCRARHAPSGAELPTDAPVDNRGRGEAFSPTDLVGTAMGTCMATLMGIAAEDGGWDLAGATVTVEKTMVADPHRRIARLDVAILVPHDPGEAGRRALERAALGCPVKRSLDPRVEVPVRFTWGSGRPDRRRD